MSTRPRTRAWLSTLVIAVAPVCAARAAIHPEVRFVDAAGESVLASGGPISPLKTCGRCHDTAYIESHSYHVSLGAGDPDAARGPAFLLRWDPLTYDVWDPEGLGGLGLADWLRRHGTLHVGGGFARRTPDGTPLEELLPGAPTAAWTLALAEDGKSRTWWDWQRSGTTEMDCFLCHLRQPDGAARAAELRAGRFGWAATATLAATGVVERRDDEWRWNAEAFGEGGLIEAETLGLGDPGNANCGQCHGAVHTGDDRPFFVAPDAGLRQTETTGEIVAPNRIRRSGMNVAGKAALSRPWDVHAARLLDCVSCHPSVNNPSFYEESAATRPTHLKVDARRLDLGEYLRTPSHDFARGPSSPSAAASAVADSMRRCEDCHDTDVTHQWLPYRNRHLQQLQCESCHVPRLFAAAREQTDWTVMTPDGSGQVVYRGVDGDPADPRTLIEGYVPLLLPRTRADGSTRLAPHNLIATWYWRDGSNGAPVTREALKDALMDGGGAYRENIVAQLDADGDGELAPTELRLVNPVAVETVRQALRERGVENPEIHAELRPYGIFHDIAPGPWAERDCQTCHGSGSRLNQPFPLAAYVPGGVVPSLVSDAGVELGGAVELQDDGTLAYIPDATAAGVYLLGFRHHRRVDEIGLWVVLLTLLGVVIHAATRIFLASLARGRRRVKEIRA